MNFWEDPANPGNWKSEQVRSPGAPLCAFVLPAVEAAVTAHLPLTERPLSPSGPAHRAFPGSAVCRAPRTCRARWREFRNPSTAPWLMHAVYTQTVLLILSGWGVVIKSAMTYFGK